MFWKRINLKMPATLMSVTSMSVAFLTLIFAMSFLSGAQAPVVDTPVAAQVPAVVAPASAKTLATVEAKGKKPAVTKSSGTLVAKKASSSTEQPDKPHGWAILDTLRNFTPNDLLFYSDPRGLISNLPEGTIVRIKALKTGFGNYYRVKKNEKNVWILVADTQDPNDEASQFFVSIVGNGIALSSDVAGGFFLESDPNTFEVVLKSDKATDNAIWELVEDPKAGDTLDSCFLRNKATKGFLTASYDSSSGSVEGEVADLRNKIEKYEKETPYLTITYARTEGILNSFDKDLSRDIKKKLQAKIQPWVLDKDKNRLDVTGSGGYLNLTGKWVSDMSGVPHKRWQLGAANYKRDRKVKIKYTEGTDKTEKEIIFGDAENSKKAFEIIADVTKHPAWPLKLKLIELEKKTAGQQKLKVSDIARTGFEKDAFTETNQWSKVAIQLVVGLTDYDDRGAPKETIAGGAARDLKIPAHKRPEVLGFGSEKIDGFGPEMIISADKLFSKGFVWLDQSLPTPGQGTVVFRAIADKGDVQVCFSDSIGARAAYRIVFGAEANTKTVIYKDTQKVQEVTKQQNDDARITPGMIERLWVSINNGFIMVGKGDPGGNIIMAWQDPEPAENIERVGFSSFDSMVKYTDVQKLADPIVMISSEIAYYTDARPVIVGAPGSPAWANVPLSPADAGAVVFNAKGSELTLSIANDSGAGYAITLGAESGGVIRLNTKESLYAIDAKTYPLAALSADKVTKFWVSFYKGLIIVGSGEIGKDPFCICVDSKNPTGIYKVGFSGTATVENLEIWPEIELGFPRDISEYSSAQKFSDFKGALSVIKPVQFRVEQNGPQVVFKDLITGQQWNVAGTPEPDADYHFSLDISADGDPKVVLQFQDPSAEKISLQKKVLMFDAQTEASFRSGQIMAYATSPNLAASIIAQAAAGIANIAGAGWSAASSALKGKLAEQQAYGDRLINTEKFVQASSVGGSVSDEAKANRQLLEGKAEAILQLKYSDPDQFEFASKQWDDIFRLITDFYVVDNAAVKSKIFDGLKELYNAVKMLDLTTASLPIYNRMVNILVKAYTNPYITKVGDAADAQRKRDWYVWVNDVSKVLLSSPALMQSTDGIEVNFKGEYLWLPVTFAQPGRGSIEFEAKAYNNIFVGFSENPYEVSNVPSRMYEVIIGMFDNKKTVIHRKSLGDTVAEFDHKKYPDLSTDPASFKKYWINVDNGVISCGVGSLGQNKIWEWKDPYPAAPVKYVGLSKWLGDVRVRNVKVGLPILAGASGWGSPQVAAPAPTKPLPAVPAVAAKAPVTSAPAKPLPVIPKPKATAVK